MSSSEPRLTKSTTARQPPQLTDIDASVLRSTVPLSTHILLVGVMLLFFSAATLITLQAPWMWWLIPAAIAVPVVAVLVERSNRVLKTREAARAMESQLRSGGAAGPTGR